MNVVLVKVKVLLSLAIVVFCLSCEKQEAIESHNGKVHFPRGEERLFIGGSYELFWNLEGATKVCIELWNSKEKLQVLEDSWALSNRYMWEVPQSILSGTDYFIRIVNAENENNFTVNTMPFELIEKGVEGVFIDKRDNCAYNTIEIGGQIWFAENFDYLIDMKRKAYYAQPAGYELYGQLYTLAEAKLHCPEGWHLPSDEEWRNLELFLGFNETELRNEGSRGRYQALCLLPNGGTGFEALYGGYYNNYANKTAHVGWEAHFWTSSMDKDGKPIVRILGMHDGGINRLGTIRHGASSVRYVKDYK